MSKAKTPFSWDDPFAMRARRTNNECAVQDAVLAYCQRKPLPRMQQAFLLEQTDPAIVREMGELSVLGSTMPEQHGGTGPAYVCYDLTARAVERVDSGYHAMMSVQSSLVIQPDEVADAVRWLCGDGAASVTGQCISVSGGEVA